VPPLGTALTKGAYTSTLERETPEGYIGNMNGNKTWE